jgi:cyclophilin family peptidyl-prolyl cis-trans isomerase
MAKHKVPTQVTVAPLFEKSELEKFVDRLKVPAGVVLIAVVGWVLYKNFAEQAEQATLDRGWETLLSGTTPDPYTRLPAAEPEKLQALADDLVGHDSGPWARLLEAQAKLEKRDFEGSLAALDALRREYPNHSLVVAVQPLADGSTGTVVGHLEAMVRGQQAWEAEHPELFTAVLPPEGSPQVQVKTGAGVIEVALFRDKAPQHVENFLKLCAEGFYDGTRFHRVQPNFMIQGGDPNSKGDDRTTWGQGGPGHTIPAEPNGLYHFRGVLSAAKKSGETESSGSQFFITTGPAHHLDGEHTVFGAVVSGMEVVDAIAAVPLSPGTADQPLQPVAIESTVVTQ